MIIMVGHLFYMYNDFCVLGDYLYVRLVLFNSYQKSYVMNDPK